VTCSYMIAGGELTSKDGRAACYILGLRHYPIFLDLKDRPVLVVGAGKVALRKVKGLLDAGARVTVVAPEWDTEFEDLRVRLVQRRFRASDLANCMLVFAATDDRLTNHRIGIAAKGKGVFANIADSAEECDFVVPARVQRNHVQIAVSTGGENPRLSAELRKTLEEIL
jgi:precorrin-2 dehydrogenase/sirohydrochlorin ferrochelatase